MRADELACRKAFFGCQWNCFGVSQAGTLETHQKAISAGYPICWICVIQANSPHCCPELLLSTVIFRLSVSPSLIWLLVALKLHGLLLLLLILYSVNFYMVCLIHCCPLKQFLFQRGIQEQC